jgi:hypothetical protein
MTLMSANELAAVEVLCRDCWTRSSAPATGAPCPHPSPRRLLLFWLDPRCPHCASGRLLWLWPDGLFRDRLPGSLAENGEPGRAVLQVDGPRSRLTA